MQEAWPGGPRPPRPAWGVSREPSPTRSHPGGSRRSSQLSREQNKLKRAGTGLRALDPERACPGFTFFARYQSAGSTVYLIDREGTVVHTWQMPYPAQYGRLTERGTLFYNGKTPETSDRFISGKPYKIGAVLEVDWHGHVLWEVQHPDDHHDGIRLRNGNVLLLCLAQLPRELVPKVKGGRPGTEHHGVMYEDYLVEMTTDGRIVWEYRTWEHLDPETDCITAIQEPRDEWTHGNGLAELPNGDIVVSFRTISTVIIIDRHTGEILWKLGAPPLCGQHAPTPLPNDNLLIFDNGPHGVNNRVFRAYRYSAEEVARAEATGGALWTQADRSCCSRRV